jgi:hypothetical protein
MFMASDRPLGQSEKTETLEAIPPAELDRLQQVELSLKGLKEVSSGRSEIGNLPGIPQRKASKDASNVLLQKFTRRTEVHLWESALRSQWARASPDVRSDQNIIADDEPAAVSPRPFYRNSYCLFAGRRPSTSGGRASVILS